MSKSKITIKRICLCKFHHQYTPPTMNNHTTTKLKEPPNKVSHLRTLNDLNQSPLKEAPSLNLNPGNNNILILKENDSVLKRTPSSIIHTNSHSSKIIMEENLTLPLAVRS